MQDPANMPLEVTCQELEMKHESMVFQFQSICERKHPVSTQPNSVTKLEGLGVHIQRSHSWNRSRPCSWRQQCWWRMTYP